LPKLRGDETKGNNSKPTQTPSTFIIHPQPTETIQDIRAALLEWTGGYWLGPYSLRIPVKGGKSSAAENEQRGKLLGKGKEGVEIREGEKLSDWFEVGEVFAHLDGKEDERVLVVQRGESGTDDRDDGCGGGSNGGS
jgi:protein TIF31